jgi:hypothetical protein
MKLRGLFKRSKKTNVMSKEEARETLKTLREKYDKKTIFDKK